MLHVSPSRRGGRCQCPGIHPPQEELRHQRGAPPTAALIRQRPMASPSSERFMRVGIMRRPRHRMGALLASIWLRPSSVLHQAAVPHRFAASSCLLHLAVRRLLKSEAAASTSLLKASQPSVGWRGQQRWSGGGVSRSQLAPSPPHCACHKRGAHHAARPLQGVWVRVTDHLSPGANPPPGQPLIPGLPDSKKGRIKPCPCHRGASFYPLALRDICHAL